MMKVQLLHSAEIVDAGLILWPWDSKRYGPLPKRVSERDLPKHPARQLLSEHVPVGREVLTYDNVLGWLGGYTVHLPEKGRWEAPR